MAQMSRNKELLDCLHRILEEEIEQGMLAPTGHVAPTCVPSTLAISAPLNIMHADTELKARVSEAKPRVAADTKLDEDRIREMWSKLHDTTAWAAVNRWKGASRPQEPISARSRSTRSRSLDPKTEPVVELGDLYAPCRGPQPRAFAGGKLPDPQHGDTALRLVRPLPGASEVNQLQSVPHGGQVAARKRLQRNPIHPSKPPDPSHRASHGASASPQDGAAVVAAAKLGSCGAVQSTLDLPPAEIALCPISKRRMANPVIASDGHTYEQSALVQYLKHSRVSPVTGAVFPNQLFVANFALRSWLENG